MINFRHTDLPAEYEPVIVDFHNDGTAPAELKATTFSGLMDRQGYTVYAVSHLGADHRQIVYLRNDMYEKAREDFLAADKNSAGFLLVKQK